MNRSCIIVDIDGTLANTEHRKHHLEGKPKDWASWNAKMGDDTPNEPIVKLVRRLSQGDMIILCTGREEPYRRMTEVWLALHGITYDGLYMRPEKDYRPDHEIKLEMLAKIRLNGMEPWLVIDDRKTVVDAWRAAGMTCLQCAEGNF